ncbi:MAG: riboflavin biosynthesis protein RibF [Elusimicrobia bacterium]|nr:riboflavin biosynthesis protein RibF [Elusimicrobiota bacterium]
MEKKCVFTMGFFDGVHTGHASLIQQVIRQARGKNYESLILTFDKKPRLVEKGDSILTPLSEKLGLLAAYGADRIEVIRFDSALAHLPPESFFRDMLVKNYKIAAIVAGYDFAFGRGRTGTRETLGALCREEGISLTAVKPLFYKGEIVSSSLIRRRLLAGDIDMANGLLGRAYSFCGRVVRGKGAGSGMGFPTANVRIDKRKLLPCGVFQGAVEIGGRGGTGGAIFNAVANIGTSPTFSSAGKSREIIPEVHVIDFNENILGREIVFYFNRKIRDEKKFRSREHLAGQIRRDINIGRNINN